MSSSDVPEPFSRKPPPVSREGDWFRRFPNGGTAYAKHSPEPSLNPPSKTPRR